MSEISKEKYTSLYDNIKELIFMHSYLGERPDYDDAVELMDAQNDLLKTIKSIIDDESEM